MQSLEDRNLLTTFEVTSLDDFGAGTLREAISSANASNGLDEIVFAPDVAGTIELDPTLGALVITDSVNILGPGSDQLTVRALASEGTPFRVFDVDSPDSDVDIAGLTISGGLVETAGAGIRFRSSGTLSIHESVITGNTANNGGGIYSEYDGSVVITSSTISGNTASYSDGGGIFNEDGDTTIVDSEISDNRSYGSGAGLFSPYDGAITITDSTITRNRVTEEGYHGGGIYSGEGNVTISGSTISGNTAADDGGGVYNIDGQLDIRFSELNQNVAGYGGGAIFHYQGSMTLQNVTIEGNRAAYADGGGIGSDRGTVTISRSTISGNSAVTDGGGIATGAGSVDLIDSLLSGNSAAYDGGGIATTTGQITITNSTISGNTANERGGGIQTDRAAVRLVNATMTLNSAGESGGGIGVIDNDNGESLLIHNSIVAQNTSPIAPDFLAPGGSGNLVIASSVIGNNDRTGLAVGGPDADGNFVGEPGDPVNAGLIPLANNGGPTLTHASTALSPGLDSGDNTLAVAFGPDGLPGGGDDVPLTTDQRGGLYQRMVDSTGNGARVDMGAHETQPTPRYVVDTNEDAVDGDLSIGDRSLRELVLIANETTDIEVISFVFGLESPIELDLELGEIEITSSLTITGPGADRLEITKNPVDPFRLFRVTGSSDVRVSGLALSGGNADEGRGGAILSTSSGRVEIVKTELKDNRAASGGAIAVTNGSLAVVGSSVHSNTATQNGGGILAADDASQVQVINSTISANTATLGGGGLYSFNTPIEIASSTIADNLSDGPGGGIGFEVNGGDESLRISNSIIAENVASAGPDFLAPGIAVSVESSLIGNNLDTLLPGSGPAQDPNGNFIGSPSSPIDPQLGPLANNGGVLPSHLLLNGSPAIDAGDVALLPADDFDLDGDRNTSEVLPRDQRGGARTVQAVDMGAVELGAVPEITWNNPADIVFGTRLSSTQLNATASVNGTFVYTPAIGTLLPAGDAQILSVQFTPIDILRFRSTTAEVALNVLKADPTITWETPDDIVFGTPLMLGVQLDASTTVQGSFAYDPGPGTILDAGLQTLTTTFTPTDTNNFNTATKEVSIQVDQATPDVTWNDPAAIVFGTALSDTQLNASADIDGSFAYTPSRGTVLNAGLGQTLSVVFTPSDSNFATVTETVKIDVSQAVPNITWNDPAAIVFGTALDETQLNATADVLGTFTYDPLAGTILNAGDDQTLSVSFEPDSPNFQSVTQSVMIDVKKAVPVITWDDPATIVFGTPLGATQLDAEADVEGTFEYTPGEGAMLNAGDDQMLSVVFTPNDSNFDVASKTVLIDVAKADPAITWPDPGSIVVGTPLGDGQLNATADVPGTFVYDPGSGTVLPLGDDQLLSVEFTPDDTANYNVAMSTVLIDVTTAFDYGDAPDGFPVLLSQDGARHVAGDLTLGAVVDTESNGQPSEAADGDGADDDGVAVIADAVAAVGATTTASLHITASNASLLSAWIDFNADGDWDDLNEQILTDVPMVAGANVLSYSIPADAVAGSAAARFRLSTEGGLLPTGEAIDGEVEDYLVTLFDGSSEPSPVVRLIDPSTSIVVDSDRWSVTDGTTTLFEAPVDAIGTLIVQGSDNDDVFTVGLGSADGLQLDGAGGNNMIIANGTAIDLTSGGNVGARNIQRFDFVSALPEELVVDRTAVATASPDTSTIAVTIGADDRLNVQNASQWRMEDPRIDGADFYVRVVHQTGGEVIELQTPVPWQNPLDASDIDDSGDVTAGDALRIINELARRSFSDSGSQELSDPLDVAWPDTYYDQNGDNLATALDALRVINRLAQLAQEGEGEAWSPLIHSANEGRFARESTQVGVIESLITPAKRIVDSGVSLPSAEVSDTEFQPDNPSMQDDAWQSSVDDLLSGDWTL